MIQLTNFGSGIVIISGILLIEYWLVHPIYVR